MIKAIFPNINNNDNIKAYKYGKFAKTDIVIIANRTKKELALNKVLKILFM